jgi:hypothetical protein
VEVLLEQIAVALFQMFVTVVAVLAERWFMGTIFLLYPERFLQ